MSESLKRTKSLRKCWCDVVLLSPNIQHNVRRTLGHRKVREDPKKQTSTTTTKKLKRKVGDENRGNPVFFFFYSPPPSVQYRAECRSVFAYSRQQQSVLPQLLLHVPDQKHTNTHKVSHNTHTLKPTNPCPQTVSQDLLDPQEDISHINGKNIWLLLYYSHWKKKHGCQTDISTIANLAASCWGDSSWYYRYYKQG